MFGSSNFMNMSDPSFLSTTETFHTPSLGDEDLEIPPMSALGDPSEELGLPGVDPSAVDDGGVVVQAFGGSLQPVAGGGIPDIGRTAIGGHPGSSAGGVIGRDFSPHFPPAQGLELPSLAIAGGLLSAEPALLDATLDMDTSPYVHAHSPHMSMAGLIHQPPQLQLQQHQQQQQQQHQQQHQQQPQRTTLQLRSHSLAGSHGGLSGPLGSMGIPHGQLTTIDQSHLGLGHGSPSPPSSKSPTPSPCSSLEPAEDPEEAARVALEKRQLVELQRKVKPSKRKKKKDPNEPLKPLSAYALFFRDTQAAIKGQNASATFGEVSKIVASMWDSLGEEQKQVYKRKAEAAKKDYLKALAAYKDGLLPQAALDPTDGELLSALQKSPGAPPAHIVLAPAATPMPPPLQPMPQVMMRPVVATHANASGGGGGAGAGVMMAGAGPAGTGGRAVGTSSVSAMGMPPPPPLMSAPHYHQRLAAQQQQQQQQMLMEQQIVLQGPMNQRPPLVVQQHQQIHVHSLVSDDLQTVQVTPLVSDSDVVMVSEPMEVQSACEEQAGTDGGIGGAGVDEVAEPEGGVAAGADDSAASADDAMQIEPMEGGGAVVQRMVEVAQQPLPLTPAAAARAATEAPVTVVQQVVQQMAQQVLVQAVVPASPPAAAGTEKSPARVECLPAPSPPHAVVTVTAEVAVSRCVRTGCNNPSVESVDWDNEYCSSECVVSHCRDVFMAWVAARTQATTATVK